MRQMELKKSRRKEQYYIRPSFCVVEYSPILRAKLRKSYDCFFSQSYTIVYIEFKLFAVF